MMVIDLVLYFSSSVVNQLEFQIKGKLDIVVGITTTCAITKVVSSNSVYDEVYSIQHYVIKLVSDLR